MRPSCSLLVCFCLSLCIPAALEAQPAVGALSGIVVDDTGAALPGARVDVSRGTDRPILSAVTGDDGRYDIASVPEGEYELRVTMPNFAAVRRSVRVEAGRRRDHRHSLQLTLSADVVVTGKRTFRTLAEMKPGAGLIGIADSASEGLVSGRQIDARPVMRVGEILETVPGVVISQHSGEGKANQYYLRGFNLDHGTDFATTVAGVPVNMPTHAHGHGYSDANFLIPELVSAVQFRKGPYFADEGDFSAAGASHIRYVNELERPLVRISGGEDGWARALAAASPQVGPGSLLLAVEGNHNDGPWRRGDDYQRLNGVARYTVGDTRNAWSLTAMAYDGTWRSTDQAPQRAIDTALFSRFDGVDDTTGGNTRRLSLSSDWQRTGAASVTRATAYALHYRLDLFSNFTYFLDDPVNGDQFQQSDRRFVSGGRVSHRIPSRLGRRSAELLVGADLRHDAIGRVALLRTMARRPLSSVNDDSVRQTSLAGYAQYEVQWTPWLRSSTGLRADTFRFDVHALEPANSGTENAGLFSPKASLVIGPWRAAEFYVNAGYGYHSNDARGTTITVDPATGEPADRVTPLARARGAEVGARLLSVPGLQMEMALWRLDLASELLFVGDAGTTEQSRPSRRWGVELNALATPRSWLTLDANLAWSRARFRDDDPAGPYVPGAVQRVGSAGATLDSGRVFGSVRWRHFGSRPLVEDGSVRSRATSLTNAQAGHRLGARTELVLDAFNVLNAGVSDIDYFYRSRLPGEPEEGVDDVHTHPALPRTLRVSLRWRF